ARALDDGEPLADYPHRLIEENLWRATRWGLAGELIDLGTGHVRAARAHLERLVEWVAPMADELGASQYLAVPAANSAGRPAGPRRRDDRGDLRRPRPTRSARPWLRSSLRSSRARTSRSSSSSSRPS